MAAHVADLLAVLDHAGIRRVVLAGHSMGAYVVARLAAEHPERASGVVLVDGGLPIPAPADRDPDEVLEEVIGPALTRLGATFPSAGAYRAMWRDHPALAQAWDDDVEAYVLYDLEPAPDGEHPAGVRSSTSADAVRVDGRELLLDETTRTAIERVRAPLWLLRAPAGLMGDERALIPRPELDAFAAARPGAHVEEVDGVNHYTILIGPGPGPGAVAAAVEAALPLPRLALGVHASEDASR
jgi:pimeloyl-ACP methyl ester carboxylesterase